MVKRGVRDKSGQFYLVAGIIISVLVIAAVVGSNFSRRQETTNIQKIGTEISVESEKVLDSALLNGRNTKTEMTTFATSYINNVNKEESYFIFGDSSLVTLTAYSETAKTISLNGQQMSLIAGQVSSQDFAGVGSSIVLSVDGNNYEFEMKTGKNFYFVVFDESGGEEHVITNA